MQRHQVGSVRSEHRITGLAGKRRKTDQKAQGTKRYVFQHMRN
jgi:hypothetical protein